MDGLSASVADVVFLPAIARHSLMLFAGMSKI
jgi:hypothetical protein